MKRKLLLAFCALLIGWSNASAQTDVTSTYITNPSFEDGNTNGWTVISSSDTGARSTSNNTYKMTNSAGDYLFNTWWKGTPITQTIANLPAGYYTLSAIVASDGATIYMIVNDDHSSYIETGGAHPSKDVGQTLSHSFLNTSTQNVKIGVVGGADGTAGVHKEYTPDGYWWYKADNFKLNKEADDNTEGLAAASSLLSSLKSTASGLLSNHDYDNVVGTERTTLNTCSTESPSSEAISAYTEVIAPLQDAISAYTAAKTNYDALVREIAKAKDLGIDAATADGYAATSSSTAATALTNTQNLKVAEYDYVTKNYAYGVELGAWTSTGTNTSAADFNNEHWSGETHSYKNQNDNNGQGWNASSWSINFNQNVLLPAGTYVFKVAGRQASGDQVTTSLVVKKGEDVLGSVNDFPRSNSSRGINKSGETDFEGEDSEFANGGKGYGWEWRYVKFTLAEDATVNIAVNSVATALHQWVSFGDYTLQADNDDVVDILAYNVAKANAITIRDDAQYVNVTGSERTELVNAINADPTSDYPTATKALNDASNAVVAAKASYDAYVLAKGYGEAINSTLLPYATTAKLTAVTTALSASVTNAEQAATAANNINTANRAAYESNMNAERVDGAKDRTSLIKNADGNNTAGWSGSFGTRSNEPYTDASGSSENTYFDKNSIKSFESSQTIKLVAGTYILSVTARAQADIDSYKLKVENSSGDEESVNLTAIGSTNGVFNRGWNVFTVEFTQEEFGDATISIVADNTTSDANLWMSWDRFRLVSIAEEGDYPVSISSSIGVATLYTPYALDFSGVDGLKAYTATVSGEEVVVTPVSDVPANTGVILKGAQGNYNIPVIAASNEAQGVLTGNATEATAWDAFDGYDIYVLAMKGDDNAQFQKATSGSVAAGKAFLKISKTNPVKAFRVVDGTATGVEAPEVAEAEEEEILYNTAGVRVGKDYKGIVINQKGEKRLQK